MGGPAQTQVSLEDFLVSEASDASGVRREWIDGHVVAMSGATPEHARLVGAVIAELRMALRGRCTVRDGSVAIHVTATRAGLRPDVSVVCGPLLKTVVEKNGRIEGEAITNPCILVEVLSQSTERDDRGWKLRDYRTIASLEEYVLVSQDACRIEVFRRSTGWHCVVAEAGASFTLHGADLSVDAIYAQ